MHLDVDSKVFARICDALAENAEISEDDRISSREVAEIVIHNEDFDVPADLRVPWIRIFGGYVLFGGLLICALIGFYVVIVSSYAIWQSLRNG